MKIFKLLSMVLIAIFISISFTACSNDKESVVPPVEDEYMNINAHAEDAVILQYSK